MADKEPNPDEEPRRPKVVDKRVSARASSAPAAQPGASDETSRPPAPEPPSAARPSEPDPVVPGAGHHAPPSGAVPGSAEPEGAFAPPPGAEPIWTPEQEAEARRVVEQISQVPARDWIADSCVRLANVASVKLDGGQTAEAQLAIDALAALVTAVGPHMGDAEGPLRQTVAQLQLAYAEVMSAPPGTR